MAIRPEHKMSLEERAKQFSPFSALRGLELALLKKEKEKLLVSRKILADDKEEEINEKLILISDGDRAEIIYYRFGEYHRICDFIDKIDKKEKCIKMGDIVINFCDITEIKIK